MKEKSANSITTKIAVASYRLAVASWLGGASLFTFVLTPTLFRSLNRDQAGTMVGYLFPGYFRWGLTCGLIALFALALVKFKRKRLAAALLVAMLVITAVQAFVIEPKAAALKREIPSFETTSPDHPLRAEFRKLHGFSAVGNLAVIGGGVVLVLLL
jgi:glucan phosphoethanolaminetransferase (alkaline phosphatase superfamily)